MNDQKLRKLAELVAKEEQVKQNVIDYVLKKLGRKDLVKFLSYLKNYSVKNTVFVKSENEIPANYKAKILDIFKRKRVVFSKDNQVKSGIKVTIEDTTIDLSIKNYLDQTIESLKSNI